VFPAGPAVVHRQYALENADGFFYAPVLGASAGFYSAPAQSQICLNMIILGEARLCDLANPLLTPTPQPIQGFYLDWETDDNRGDATAPDKVTDLFTVTVRLLAAAAHGKGLQIGAGFDPRTGSGKYVGLTSANAGLILADITSVNPGGGLDFVNIVSTNAPPPTADAPPGDLEMAALQTQLGFYQSAIPAIANLPSKILLELALDPPYKEISRFYAASARNFLIANGITSCAVPQGDNYPGGALARPYNQALAAFFGLSPF
jgi:hypothetical protein